MHELNNVLPAIGIAWAALCCGVQAEALAERSMTRQLLDDADVSLVSLNHKSFSGEDPSHFRFLVAGHIYGNPGKDDLLPASTLLHNLTLFDSADLSMVIFLGDTVREASAAHFDALDSNLLSRFSFPIFNAVGNHDIGDRTTYEQRYGPSFYSFRYGPAQMIFLDTELADCAIVGKQRRMLDSAIAHALQDDSIHHIFVFMHKVLFLDGERLLNVGHGLARANVFYRGDDAACSGSNYSEILSSNFWPAAQEKPVYLMAGDVGAWGGNLSPFFHEYPESSLTAIATGIGDTRRDSVVLVTIDGSESQFEVVSLTGQVMRNIDEYGMEYWKTRAWLSIMRSFLHTPRVFATVAFVLISILVITNSGVLRYTRSGFKD